MKKVGRRWAVGPWMIAGGLLALTPEAQAGEWNFSYDFTGTKVDVGTTSPWRAVAPFPGLPPQTNAGGGTTTDGAASASTSGTITLICKWTPAPGGDTVPKAVRIPTSAVANVAWQAGNPVPQGLTGAANDGGRTVTGEDYQEFTSYQSGTLTNRKWATSSQLLKPLSGGGVPSNGESKTWRIPVSVSAQFSGSNRFSGAVSVNVGLPVEDTRSVKLTRNDKDRFELKNGNWVTYGDSRFSFLRRVFPVPGGYEDRPQMINQTITAVPEGAWSNEASHIWNPGGENDTTIQHSQEMTQGNSVWNPDGVDTKPEVDSQNPLIINNVTKAGAVPGGWSNAEHGGSTLKVFYKKTDNDGAIAEATYIFTLHDEWENPTPDNSLFWLEAPNDTPHYGESLSDWIPRGMPSAVGTTASKDDKWKIGKTANLDVELKAETSANFGLADWLKFSGSASSTAKLGVQTEIEYSITPAECFPNAPITSSFQPIVRYKVRSKRIVLDRYTEEGRDINPARNNPPSQGPLAPPSDGKWPKSGESDISMYEPYWLEIEDGQGPMQNSTPFDGDLPDVPSTSEAESPSGNFS